MEFLLENSTTLREVASAEVGYIRRFVPNELCYVYLSDSTCTIDEVMIANGHVSFNVMRRESGTSYQINDVSPDQLRPFPSGVCCWGNNDIDMFLFKFFKGKNK